MDAEKGANGCGLAFMSLLSLALILSPFWIGLVSPIPKEEELIKREIEGPLKFVIGESWGQIIFEDGKSISFSWPKLERCRLAIESLNRKVILVAPKDLKHDRRGWGILEYHDHAPPTVIFSYEEARKLEEFQDRFLAWAGWGTVVFIIGMLVFERSQQRKHEALVRRSLGDEGSR